MEQGIGDDSSDKDKKMKNSFESSSDDDKKEVKKDESSKETPNRKSLSLEKLFSDESKKDVAEAKGGAKKFRVVELLNSFNQEKTETQTGEDNDSGIEIEQASAGHEHENKKEVLEASGELTEDERTEVVKDYVENMVTEAHIDKGKTPVESVGHAEAEASITFYENLKSKIENDEPVNERVIEKVASDVIGESSEVEDKDEPSENEVDTHGVEFIEDTVGHGAEEEYNTEANATSGGVTIPGPPVPPVNHAGSVGRPTPPIYQSNLPNPASVNSVTGSSDDSELSFAINRRRSGDVLLGGIVGYLIGRRRGRIKSERELLPVQTKLEKEVVGLQNKIIEQEQRVRAVAAENFELKHSRSVVIEKAPARLSKSTESNNGSQADRSPEGAETVEKSSESLPVPEKTPTPKAIETMSLPLLMEIANSIKIDNISLKSIFESGRINQSELRDIIKHHLAGENIEMPVSEPEIKLRKTVENIDMNSESRYTSNVNDAGPEERHDAHIAKEDSVNNNGTGLNTDYSDAGADRRANQPDELLVNNKQLYTIVAVAVIVAVVIIIFVF
ncbi:MAG: hypothetical protein U0451_00300 [Candidatus Saccharimonadales bacterium]